MFITREFDYALRTLRALSSHRQMSVKEICDVEHIPQPYCYKILKKLNNGQVVEAHRGTKGGYTLTKSAEAISLYDIYTAIEGQLYINECMQGEYECVNNTCGRHCNIHKELTRMQDSMIQHMKQRSLADMLGTADAAL